VTYQERLNHHLVRYKKAQLGPAAQIPGTFSYRGKDLPYEHILPRSERWANLIEPARTQAQAYLAGHPTVTLHKYFHHLNSSQAFAFNLFFPYFSGGPDSSAALLRALGQSGIVVDWEPECVPDPAEGTNVDVVWKSSAGVRTYCEVKLSETDFGTAPADKAHEDKLLAVYASPLTGCIEPTLLQPAAFFDHYQLLRNLWQIADKDAATLIFPLPRANETVWNSAVTFRERVTEPLRSRVFVIAIEDVLSVLAEDTSCPDSLREYAVLLRAKYVP
jgi:Restriction Endonuclease associating with ARP